MAGPSGARSPDDDPLSVPDRVPWPLLPVSVPWPLVVVLLVLAWLVGV